MTQERLRTTLLPKRPGERRSHIRKQSHHRFSALTSMVDEAPLCTAGSMIGRRMAQQRSLQEHQREQV